MKRNKRKSDIMDLVTLAGPEAVRQVDELGYSFLAEHGYDVTGWDDADPAVAEAARNRIVAALEERGEQLPELHGAYDEESPLFVVWYSLWRGEKQIGKSQVLKLVYRKQREGGEGT